MSNEMIERVAKMISEKRQIEIYGEIKHPWYTNHDLYKDKYYKEVKDIIQAMREPTKEMIEAGECKFFDSNNLEVKMGWQAMIDAALKKD